MTPAGAPAPAYLRLRSNSAKASIYMQVLSFQNVLSQSQIGISTKNISRSIGNYDSNAYTKFHWASSIGDRINPGELKRVFIYKF